MFCGFALGGGSADMFQVVLKQLLFFNLCFYNFVVANFYVAIVVTNDVLRLCFAVATTDSKQQLQHNSYNNNCKSNNCNTQEVLTDVNTQEVLTDEKPKKS